jgi:hypothetical protein
MVGAPVGTLVLIGWTGSAQWPAFAASPEAQDGAPDPLDRWSRRILASIATSFGARPLDPSRGPPWYPFQRWARRAGGVDPSPLGLLIAADLGLWHAYRGALAFDAKLPLPPAPAPIAPCAACRARPCLTACPVGAYDGAHFAADRCASHVRSTAGQDCREFGCRARRACPVGAGHAYGPAQSAFHMGAFLGRRPSATTDVPHGADEGTTLGSAPRSRDTHA